MPADVESDRGVGTHDVAVELTGLAQLVARASERVVVNPSDGKSGAHFEQLTIDGAGYFLKVLSYEADWIMRCSGNTDFWEHKVWLAGLYDRVPNEIDHAMVAMALDDGRLSMLQRDISDSLIPEGDALVTVEQHDAFMDHMAAFHAAYWGFVDTVGLSSIEQRIGFFSDENMAREMRAADPPVPVRVAREGWTLLPERAPVLAAIVNPARANPTPLADRLRAAGPPTFVIGDWKMGNLGYHAVTQQTVLLDWAYPGAAPGCWDLMWYLALNRARLPRTKEESIAAYREGLDRRGITTAGWFDDQLQLCAVGVMTLIAWEKAVGDADELAWWTEAVTRGGVGRSRR